MATTNKALGPTAGVVGINLTTATHLAGALARAADELAAQARSAHSPEVVGLPAAQISLVATWAAAQARSLELLVDRLGRIHGGPVRWYGGTDPGFAHPFLSVRRGREIADALTAGDLTAARRLLAAHGGDPVVATALVGALDVDQVLLLLRIGHAEWTRTDDVGEDQRAVLLGLGGALATALRHGTSTLGIAELADAAGDVELPVSALSLLFAGGARFPTTSLREAVASVVLPLNAQLLADDGLGIDTVMVGGLDARVMVLDAVARDRRASLEAIGIADLDELLDGDLAYPDGGVALARVLLAATTPLDRLGLPVDRPLTTTSPVDVGLPGVNAHRVIDWVGRHGHTPLAVQAELGRLAAPWIGSFRSDGLDRVVRRHLALDEGLARSYLAYAQVRDGVSEDLRDAAWTWAADELHDLSGPRFDGGGFDAVGSVLGVVTISGLDAEAERAGDEDERRGRVAELWERATRLAASRLPMPANVVGEEVVERLLDEVLPTADRELQLWRDVRDEQVLHEHLALDHLTASILVARGHLRPPPRLLDHAGALRHPLTFDAQDIVAWTEWRSRTATGGPAPLQLAGDQFLRETRD